MRLYLKIAMVAASCLVFASLINAAIPADYTGKPFCCDTLMGRPQQIPGVVKGTFFDSGGSEVAFHDSPGNQGGSMRLKNGAQIQADLAVDMQSYSGNDWDVTGWGTNDHFDSSVNATPVTWHLSWLDASGPTTTGDWYKYTVHVNVAGTYAIDSKQAEANAPPNLQLLTFYNGTSVRVDSIKDLPACITPPGCPEVWHAWFCFMNIDTITLDTGLQVVKMAFVNGSWNWDWIRFRLQPSSIKQPAFIKPAGNSLGLKTTLSGDVLSISYNHSQSATTKISLVDCTGRIALSNSVPIEAVGSQNRTFNVRNIRQGVYFVRVEQNGCTAVKSLTITH